MNYKINKKFHFRECLLDLSYLKSVEKDNYNVFLKLNCLKEALQITNSNLLDSFNSPFKTSIKNYIKRSITRPTPFGLFGAVGVAEVGKKEKEDSSVYLKRVDADASWLMSILKDLEQDLHILNGLNVAWNQFVIENNHFYKITNLKNWGEPNNFKAKNIVIKNSDILTFIKYKTKKPVPVKKLVKQIIAIDETKKEKDILEFVSLLIRKEVLISSLKPNVSKQGLLSDAIKKLSFLENNESYLKLKEIQKFMNLYENTPVGEGTVEYSNLKKLMEKMSYRENGVYVKVDLITTSRKYISTNIAEKIESAINFLSDISPRSIVNEEYSRYVEYFIECYGMYDSVPVKILLDNDRGLGFPTFINSVISGKEQELFQKYIRNKVFESVKRNEKTISLDSVSSTEIYGENRVLKNNVLPKELEVFVSNSSGDIALVPHTGSDLIGKSFGRFTSYFPKNKFLMNSDNTYIELTEFPTDNIGLNVGNTTFSHNKSINLGYINDEVSSEIFLDDIFVKTSKIYGKDMLILVDINGNILNFTSSTMLNPKSNSIYSNISQFLLYITKSVKVNPLLSCRLLEDFSELTFVPSFTYKGVTICREKWILDKKTLLDPNQFKEWKEFWDVPNLLTLNIADESLLINLNSQEDLHFLEKNIDDYAILTSYPQETLTKTSKYYEMVFSFQRQNEESYNQINHLNELITVHDDSLINNYYSDWLYFVLIGIHDRAVDLIIKVVIPFFEELLIEEKIKQFHYLMYSDEGKKSLRLRILRKDMQVDEDIYNFVNKMLIEQYCFDVSQKIYRPELTRYGGIECIADVENIFTCDSIACGKLLQSISIANLDSIQYFIEISKSVLVILCSLQIPLDYFGNLLLKNYPSQEMKKYFRKKISNNKLIIENFLPYFMNIDIPNEQLEIYNAFNRFQNSQSKIHSIKKNDIAVLSIIHMHFNRLNVDNNTEKKIMFFLKYIFEVINGYEKNRKPKIS